MEILEIAQGVLHVPQATTSVILHFNSALNPVLTVFTSRLPQFANFAVAPV